MSRSPPPLEMKAPLRRRLPSGIFKDDDQISPRLTASNEGGRPHAKST